MTYAKSALLVLGLMAAWPRPSQALDFPKFDTDKFCQFGEAEGIITLRKCYAIEKEHKDLALSVWSAISEELQEKCINVAAEMPGGMYKALAICIAQKGDVEDINRWAPERR